MRTGATKVISVLSVAACVAAIVFGFIAFSNNSRLSPELETLLQNSGCADSQDRDACLFVAVWNSHPNYTLNASENQNDRNASYLLKSDDKQDFYMAVEGDQPRQTISKDGHIYVLSGNIWQQQEFKDQTERNKFRESNQLEFIRLDNIGNFSRSGEEKCFDKDCLVYEIGGQERSTKVWFDTANFRLQRVLIQGDNYNYNATIDYDSEVKVDAPVGSKALATGQQLAPGGGQISSTQTSEPSLAASGDNGLPATGDSGDPEEYEQWLKQRR